MSKHMKDIMQSIRTIVDDWDNSPLYGPPALYGPPTDFERPADEDWGFSWDGEKDEPDNPFAPVEIPLARRLLIFLVDTNERMGDKKMAIFNTAFREALEDVDVKEENDCLNVVNILDCVDSAHWIFQEPMDIHEIKHRFRDFEAKGMPNWEEAFGALNDKLSKSHGWINDLSSKVYPPVIILLSDGENGFEGIASSMEGIKENPWFKLANKIAVAIGDDADKTALASFTGYAESVIDMHHVYQLEKMIVDYDHYVRGHYDAYIEGPEDMKFDYNLYNRFMQDDPSIVEFRKRRVKTLFFLCDTPSDLERVKVSQIKEILNDAVYHLSSNYLDRYKYTYQLKVAILVCAHPVHWVYPEPMDILPMTEEMLNWNKWPSFEVQGVSDWATAFDELNQKLSKTEGWVDCIPSIVLLSDGAPSDEWSYAIEKLKDNYWFRRAPKVAFAIGDDADIDVLVDFTGNVETILPPYYVNQLKNVVFVPEGHDYCDENWDEKTAQEGELIFPEKAREYELQEGTIVWLKNGKTCEVKKELGRGDRDRRIVYAVDYEGEEYALAWYKEEYYNYNERDDLFFDSREHYRSGDFFEDLENIINAGVPDANFIWPLAIAEWQQESCGYLMKERSQGYVSMRELMESKTQFADVKAQLNACLQIAKAYQKLHNCGLCFFDTFEDVFYINPITGDVLTTYEECIAPYDAGWEREFKTMHLAPEIVEHTMMPNQYSDYHSLAVCLFLLIFRNHPFKGKGFLDYLDKLDERESYVSKYDYSSSVYGFSSIFIMDPSDESNRPVNGVHDAVIKLWSIYPSLLANAFCKTFGKEAINDPTKRLTDRQWFNILLQVRSMLVKCPNCGKSAFLDVNQPNKPCVWCNKTFPACNILKVGRFTIPLVLGQVIYDCQLTENEDISSVAGEVIAKEEQLGIRNHSSYTWTVTLPDGGVKSVAPGGGMPIRAGLKIKFGDSAEYAEII